MDEIVQDVYREALHAILCARGPANEECSRMWKERWMLRWLLPRGGLSCRASLCLYALPSNQLTAHNPL